MMMCMKLYVSESFRQNSEVLPGFSVLKLIDLIWGRPARIKSYYSMLVGHVVADICRQEGVILFSSAIVGKFTL